MSTEAWILTWTGVGMVCFVIIFMIDSDTFKECVTHRRLGWLIILSIGAMTIVGFVIAFALYEKFDPLPLEPPKQSG